MDAAIAMTSTEFSKIVLSQQEENDDDFNIYDYMQHFTTDQVFHSRDSLSNWVCTVGKELGLVIVIIHSKSGGYGRKSRIRYGCKRSGKYRKRKYHSDHERKRKRFVGTRKCECPFDLNGVKLSNEHDWMLKVLCGLHNHPVAQHLEGHPYVARLTNEDENILIDLSKSLVKPRNILMTLKERDPNNVSTMRTIYNARARHRLNEKAGKTQMQQLLSKLKEYNYIEWHRSHEKTDEVKDFFFAHPTSVDFLHAFPCVLIMDCTYKTNRYRCPLFEIVGVTSTQMTFSIAFVFMEVEREANYTWAMEKLKTLMNHDVLPQVVVTDRELALIQAVENIFPKAKNLLCTWHISKNVFPNTKKFFDRKEEWVTFCRCWSVLVASNTEDIYEQLVKTLFLQFAQFPKALDYVLESWLSKYKEKFVAAWTNKIMHFGNVTTNRVESAHSKLKKHLGSSQGDFETPWKVMHHLLKLQFSEIKASFEQSMNLVQHNFKRSLFRELRGLVSMSAMNLISRQSDQAERIGLDKKYIVINHPIPLSTIHPHWRKLDTLVPSNDTSSKLNIVVELENIQRMFGECDDAGKLVLKMKLREMYEPSTTSLVPPAKKIKTKGRPSSKVDTSTKRRLSYFEIVESGNDSKFPITASSVKVPKKRELKVRRTRMTTLDQYITCFHDNVKDFIFNIVHVKSDGHCGFRAVASSLGLGKEAWLHIRRNLITEVESNYDAYIKLYGSNETVKELLYILDYFDICAPFDRWMTMPDMGHLIASPYGVVLVLLSSIQCLTFLPLHSQPPLPLNQKIISLGFVNSNHFVQVNLKPNCPIPPVAYNWYKYRGDIASGWESSYKLRIETFKEIIGTDVATHDIFDLKSP